MIKVTSSIFAVFMVILAGCGGGGVGVGVGGPPSLGSNPSSTNTAVSIDSSVPLATKSILTTLTSPLGSGPLAKALAVPSAYGSDSTILLVGNGSDDIFLAGERTASDPAPVLSAESTSVVLARLAQGSLPAGITAAQFRTVVRATAEFPKLVALVTSALQAAMPPIDLPGVASSVLTVLSQAKAKGFSANAPNIRVNAQSSSKKSIETPLPYYVLKDKAGIFTVKVTKPDVAVLGIKLKNGFPINFGAFSEKVDGSGAIFASLPLRPDGIRQAVLPAAQLLTIIESDPEIALPGNGELWNLTIQRTPYARYLDGVEIVQDTIEMLLDNFVFVGKDCLGRAAAAVVTSSVVKIGAVNQSSAAWRVQLEEAMTNKATYKKATDEILKCATTDNLVELAGKYTEDSLADSVLPFMRASAKFVGKFVVVVTATEKLYDAGNIATKFAAAIEYWNFDETFRVCQTKDPKMQELQIYSCAVSLEFDKPNLSLGIGEKYRYDLIAKDIKDQPTLVPAILVFSSDKPSLVSIDQTGVITMLKETATNEPVTITVKNPATGITGTAYVTVGGVSAELFLNPTSITLGGTATLQWTSKNATGCSIVGVPGTTSTSGSLDVTPTAVGTYTYSLSCQGPAGADTGIKTLTVLPASTPVLVDAWVKYKYQFINLSFATANETSFMSNVWDYVNLHQSRDSLPKIGYESFINDAIGGPYTAPGELKLKQEFYYSLSPSGSSPIVYSQEYGSWAYVTSYDVTLHSKSVIDVVSDPAFTPVEKNIGINTITVIVHSSNYPNDPVVAPNPKGIYGSLHTYGEPAYRWVREPAYIVDADGNGYDDKGEQDNLRRN